MEQSVLFIPQGMKAKREWFQGVGQKEIARIVAASVVLVAIVLVVYLITTQPIYAVGMLLIGESIIIMMTVRSPGTNMSAIDLILLAISFSREQQEYEYQIIREYDK